MTIHFGMAVAFQTRQQAHQATVDLAGDRRRAGLPVPAIECTTIPDPEFPHLLLTGDHAALSDAQPGTFKILA